MTSIKRPFPLDIFSQAGSQNSRAKVSSRKGATTPPRKYRKCLLNRFRQSHASTYRGILTSKISKKISQVILNAHLFGQTYWQTTGFAAFSPLAEFRKLSC